MSGTPKHDNFTESPGWIPEGIWRSRKPSTVSTWSHLSLKLKQPSKFKDRNHRIFLKAMNDLSTALCLKRYSEWLNLYICSAIKYIKNESINITSKYKRHRIFLNLSMIYKLNYAWKDVQNDSTCILAHLKNG